MIERNNPSIDVDDLMSRIQQEVSKRGVGLEPIIFEGDGSEAHGLGAIEALVNTAQAKAEVRTQWSGRFNVFPFNQSAPLQRVALKALAFMFKDQRHVNLASLAALRELLIVNRELTQRISSLEAELRQTEARLMGLELRL